MNELIIMWGTGVMITFIMFVIGVKTTQTSDYETATHEDKEFILLTRFKEPLLYILYITISFFWFIILPSIIVYLTVLKKEERI